MPTPRKGYHLDGEPIPGASTIAGYYKPKPAVDRLLGWARKEALAGRHHTETLQQAANIGTTVHAMVEAKIKGEPIICDREGDDATAAWAAFGAYEKWATDISIEPIAQEVPLISKIYRFGGTPDLIGSVRKKIRLFDWKTSSAVYESHGMQASAYVVLWNENYPEQKINDGVHIIAFTKSGELKPTFLEMSDLSVLWEQFLDALRMWRRQNVIDQLMQRSAQNV